MPEERGIEPVSRELQKRVVRYRTAIAMVKKMVLEGILSEEEYSEIDTMLRGKYEISLSTIFD